MIPGLITSGLGLASMLFGGRSATQQANAANQGFNYLKQNPVIGAAQGAGIAGFQQQQDAAGLSGALLGLGGDQAAADAGFQQFQDSTGYQFRVDQGMRGIEGSRAARGVLNSGATAKELTTYGQNMASAEFQNYLNQLNQERQLSGQQGATGLNAALGVGSAGSAAGGNVAGAIRGGTEDQMSGLGGLVRGVASIFGF